MITSASLNFRELQCEKFLVYDDLTCTNHLPSLSRSSAVPLTPISSPEFLQLFVSGWSPGQTRVYPGDQPLTKSRRNSGLEIALTLACVAGGILSRVRGRREAMAAEPPILAAKPREASAEAARLDFKAAPSHSPRDFAARIHSPLSKFYVAREQSRQLRRLSQPHASAFASATFPTV